MVRRVWLIIEVKMLLNTSLAKGHLMCHTKGVDNRVMLVAEQHPRLLGPLVVHHLICIQDILVSWYIVTHIVELDVFRE
jgi:hypothetical protein